MTAATIPAFENTVQKTNIWLKDIRKEMNWKDSEHERSYRALRVVLQNLRDHLPVEESSDFSAQLPMLVRGIYFEGWNAAKTPVTERSREQFLSHLEKAFPDDIIAEPEPVARAVFKVISKHVTSGEVGDVKQALPKPIRELWN